MMFVGYVWACIAASLVLALGTLTPQWDNFFGSLGVQSSQAQSAAMWVVVGIGARHHFRRRLFADAACHRH